MLQYALALDVIQVLDGRNFFNLSKVSTVPCMFTAVLSLSLSLSLSLYSKCMTG